MQAKPERRFFVIWLWNKGQLWRPDTLRDFIVDTAHGGPHASRAEAESARAAFGLLEELALAELAKVE